MRVFLRKRAFIIAIPVTVLVIIGIALSANGRGDYTTTNPNRGDLIRTVEVSGTVVPTDDASLGFEIAGTIARVNYDVGERVLRGATIVELESSALLAELSEARAALAKIDSGGSYTTKTDNARRAVIQAIADAYTQADDAIHNRADQVFTNPRSQNPEIIFAFDDISLRDLLNLRRPRIEEVLTSWRTLVDRGATSYTDADLSLAKSYANTVSQFLDDVARAVSKFKSSGGLSQTTIDKYRADIAVGRQNLNTAISALISEGDSLRESLSDIPVQAARVALAEARLSKSRLTAPFSGVISRQDAEVGESATVGNSLVRLISEVYEIEAYVPEVSIAGVSLENTAKVTLDAYDDDIVFDARVRAIDPAETVRDGVSTYRILLSFVKPDARIRSGMTANISIETKRVPNTLLVPERAIIRTDDETAVYVLVAEKEMERRVVSVGERDSSGNVEILDGLTESDAVLINPPKE